ncbi:carboxypeptidase B-like [Bicyclus anynana]|uniref:Carboxypeptidase B-like n=1 Tax=Bicyclus anynana TaxID=110368 RepID=A0A6J1P2I4_BICAN|nr:carboxypeptidase B-like [Bicyclus anynana]XP_052744739.1 carboxypeptidase B-like [Bicyclus anynana]
MFKVLFFLFATVFVVHAKHEEYIGYTLYGVTVYDRDQNDQLMDIVERYTLDVWSYASLETEGLILVAPELKPVFEDEITSIGVTYRIDTDNIKEKLDLEDFLLAEAARKSNSSRSERFGISFDEIHRWAVVDRFLGDVASRFPRLATVVNAGRSVEGRNIRYLRISSNNFATRTKPIIVIQCMLHAREWVTLPVALWAIQELVINSNSNQDLIRDIDWIVLPIANPDGYEFSHTRTRMWRKNRRTGFTPSNCIGVDLNRNFNHNWGTASSNNPCSDTFHGPRAFSEPESVVTRNILSEFRTRIAMFLDVHSFGSLILYGFANRQLPPNQPMLNRVGNDMARRIDAVKWPQNRNYRVGNSATILYTASGVCGDYAQVAIGTGLSYTYELPAHRNLNNINGFLVDPAFIRQAGFETWEGIKVAARFIARR